MNPLFCSQLPFRNKFTISIFFMFFLSFSTQSTELEPLDDDEGYLVLAANISGFKPRHLVLTSESLLQGNHLMESLSLGENVRVIKIKEGTYHWSKLKISKRYIFEFEEDDYVLKVAAGKVNYAGHIVINVYPQFGTANFRFVNRVSLVFDELDSCCNDLLERHPLAFSGVGSDPFIEYFSDLKFGEKKINEAN